jgi:hypothetical protein
MATKKLILTLTRPKVADNYRIIFWEISFIGSFMGSNELVIMDWYLKRPSYRIITRIFNKEITIALKFCLNILGVLYIVLKNWLRD